MNTNKTRFDKQSREVLNMILLWDKYNNVAQQYYQIRMT